ncbi:hypothetical protein [Streptomyces sp. Ag109_O5-1]|uniref:hypothetical protein n=1 Tax=Streptomyces sp. Ag109_O5-1 TaxID=1938851 RepID=UPI0021A3B488|nr:hypothetical protein [Streptomyces sp. Ag109_O5-1]
MSAVVPKNVRWVLLGVMLAMLLSLLDNMVVSTAMPTIVGDLGGLERLLGDLHARRCDRDRAARVHRRGEAGRRAAAAAERVHEPPQLPARDGADPRRRCRHVRRGPASAAVPADRAGRLRDQLLHTLGGSLGVAVFGSLFTRAVRSALPAGGEADPNALRELPAVARSAYPDAVTTGTGHIFLTAAALCASPSSPRCSSSKSP